MRTVLGGFWVLVLYVTTGAQAQVNVWSPTAGGKWETGASWSLGSPPASAQSIFITNIVSPTPPFSKFISIDATTALSNGINGCLTIQNLLLYKPGNIGLNNLSLANAGTLSPLRVNGSLTISNFGNVTVTNSAIWVGGTLTNNGSVSLNTGAIIATNAAATVNLYVGSGANGQMTVTDGTLDVRAGRVGELAGANGTMTFAGGQSTFQGLVLGNNAGAHGTVWVTGGILTQSGGSLIRIGLSGTGHAIVSNGLLEASVLYLTGPGATLTVAGGIVVVNSTFQIPTADNSTGTVWLTAGSVVTPAITTSIGNGGVGRVTVSNGTWTAREVTVANTGTADLTIVGGDVELSRGLTVASVGRGTLTIAGGNTVASNLTIGVAGNRFGAAWITGGRLVTTNSATVLGQFGVATVVSSNGTWLARSVTLGEFGGGQGTLTVAGGTNAFAGPLTVGTAGPGTGTIWVTGGLLVITNTPATVTSGTGFLIDGTVTLTNGSAINVSNVSTIVGHQGAGSLTNVGATLSLTNLTVGNLVGSSGTLVLNGGLVGSSGDIVIGSGIGAAGTVWIHGGVMATTNFNRFLTVGSSGSAQVIVSNGTVRAVQLIGNGALSSGTLTVAGGTNELLAGTSVVGNGSGSLGTIWLVNGVISATNTPSTALHLGNSGTARLTISNGVLRLPSLQLGVFSGGAGTLTVAGGSAHVFTNLTLGRFDCTGLGSVAIAGGSLLVTNSIATAVLEVRSGTLTLMAGTLRVDQLVLTNSCGVFRRTGGTLTIGSTNLAPNLSAVGDGIPNGWKQQYGFDVFDPTVADADNDEDGFTNAQEFQAGTDPTDASSYFAITGITREGSNIRISWSTGPGAITTLERTAGAAGSYSNNFAPIFTVNGATSTSTNYLDVGAATNHPALFYRVVAEP